MYDTIVFYTAFILQYRQIILKIKRKNHMKFFNHSVYLLLILLTINDYLYAQDVTTKRAIIIGASVGMGKELAKQLAADGYIVGMASRRITLLEEIQQEIPTQTYIAYLDAAKPDEAVNTLNTMIEEMGGLDLLVLAITGYHDSHFDSPDWKESLPVLEVDIIGFFALARTGFNFFENQGHGHLVGFSSIDGLRGVAGAPAYSGAKAFCSRYLDAERN